MANNSDSSIIRISVKSITDTCSVDALCCFSANVMAVEMSIVPSLNLAVPPTI